MPGVLKRFSATLRELISADGGGDPLERKRRRFANELSECQTAATSFATFPHADATPLLNLLQRAEKAAQPATAQAIDAGLQLLATFEGKLSDQRSLQKSAAKDAERERGLMPKAQEAFQRAQALAADLRANCPGIEDVQRAIDTAIAAAAQCIAAGRWGDALQALKPVDDQPSRKDCAKRSEAARGKVQLPEYETARQKVEQLGVLLSAAGAAPYREAFAALQRRLLAPVSDAQVVAEMRRFAAQATAELARHTAARDAADAAIQAMEKTDLPRAQSVAPTLVAMALEERLQAAKGAFGLHDFAQADTLTRELQRDMQATQAQYRSLADAWARADGEWTALVKRLKDLAAAPGVPTPDAQTARGLAGRQGEVKQRIGDRDWDWLLASLALLRREADRIDAAVVGFGAFKAQRDAADLKVQAADGKVEVALNGLQKALADAKFDAALGRAPFDERRKALLAEWARRMTSAADAAALGVDDMLGRFVVLEQDAAQTAAPSGLKAIGDGQAAEALRREGDALRSAIEAVIAEVEPLDRSKTKGLRGSLAGAEAKCGTDWKQRVGLLKTVKQAADTALAAARDGRAARVQALLDACQGAQTLVDETWATLRKTKEKQFKPVFDSLREEVTALRMLAESDNAEAGNAVKARVEALRKRVEAMKVDAAQPASPLTTALKAHDELEEEIDKAKKTLEADAPKQWTALREDADALKKDLFTLEPAAVATRIAAVRLLLAAAQDEAATVGAQRAAIDDLRGLVKTKLEMLEAAGTAPEYTKKLRERSVAAVKLADTPQKAYQAKTQLDGVHHELDEALLHPAQAVARQQSQLAAAEASRLAEVEWKSRLAVFEKRQQPAAEKAVDEADGDRALLGEIERMLKVAKESAKAGDHTGALRQLGLCVTRVQQVVADPHGPALGSRKALPADAGLYRESVVAFAKALDAFPDAVAKKVDKLPDAVKQKVAQLVTDVRNQFDPGAFDLPAARIADEKAAATERRAQREAALARIRVMRNVLQAHPTLQKLRRNPVAPLEPAVALVEQRLARLEANIRRAVH